MGIHLSKPEGISWAKRKETSCQGYFFAGFRPISHSCVGREIPFPSSFFFPQNRKRSRFRMARQMSSLLLFFASSAFSTFSLFPTRKMTQLDGHRKKNPAKWAKAKGERIFSSVLALGPTLILGSWAKGQEWRNSKMRRGLRRRRGGEIKVCGKQDCN